MNFYYSHGRTAFKYGLKYLDLKKNDKILIPEYVCDILLDPLYDLKIKPVFYKITENFICDFESIKKKWNKSVKALLLINYFGFEEDKKKYLNFCKKKNIFLIEDSCHSFNLNFRKKHKSSDIIFYSPKKIIPELYSGGLLKIKKKNKNNVILKKKLIFYKVSFYQLINTFLEKNFLSIKKLLKYFFFRMPTFSKINSIKNERVINDLSMDIISHDKLKKINLKKISKQRQRNYDLWKKFCKEKNFIIPIERKLDKNTIPWLMPAYITNSIDRKKIFNYGWKNGYSITSWPKLPNQNINKQTRKIWNSLVCFNTDRAPSKKEYVDF